MTKRSPQERWKRPVGEFIEERYWKRSGGDVRDHEPRQPDAQKPSRSDRGANVSPRAREATWQLSDLVCYLVNLADDLQAWLAHGSIDPEVPAQIREELQEIAKALETGAPISPLTEIPIPPRAPRRGSSRRTDRERSFDDDEIPL